MKTPPVWVAELAERFWSAVGPPPPFPRDLTRAVTDSLPLGIAERPNLTLSSVLALLHRRRIPVTFAGPDRPLRAALYCWHGRGGSSSSTRPTHRTSGGSRWPTKSHTSSATPTTSADGSNVPSARPPSKCWTADRRR